LLEGGFERREAIVLIRAVWNLLSGYLLLIGQDDHDAERLDAHELDLRRRRVELSLLSLPREEFPNIVASAADMANVWLSDPDNGRARAGPPLGLGVARARTEGRPLTLLGVVGLGPGGASPPPPSDDELAAGPSPSAASLTSGTRGGGAAWTTPPPRPPRTAG